MVQTYEGLKKLQLFMGIPGEDMERCLRSLDFQEKNFQKDSLIFHAGSETKRLGLVLSGSVTIESTDIWGNCTILSHVGPGQVFAETYALLSNAVMLVDVRANEDCRILFLNVSDLFNYPFQFSWDEILLKNLLKISAQKNLTLSGRSFHTSPKSARSRILSYLNTVSLQKNADEFDIPFNRQQLADYLNLERTNMSKELSRMQREGLIEFRKNHFKLLTETV